MNTAPPSPNPTLDGRLAAALEEYQGALEAGRPVERAAFLARFADVAGLAGDLDALDNLHRAAAALRPRDTPPRLADFEIVREVGRGGMGVVYEARQRSLGRRVAIKVLPGPAAADDQGRRRFLHEARIAALVQHPNAVPVFHVGDEGGVPFYVMPFVDGPSLADAIAARQCGDAGGAAGLPTAGTGEYFAAVARVGVEAAGALAEAHALGIIHRDVKPANLLLDRDGRVKVIDFGLAVAPFADGLTRIGVRPGTPRYMSPEQLTGPRDRLDARTDVYSLGVTLYELATLRAAFPATDEPGLIDRVTRTDPPPPRSLVPALPADLETVILKAMAKDPADRYPSARDLGDDLSRFLDHRPILARRPGAVTRLTKWVRRNRRAVALTTGTLVAGTILGLGTSAYVVWSAFQRERAARADDARHVQLAIGAVSHISDISDDILSHAPGLLDRQLTILAEVRDTLEPFADDASLGRDDRRRIARLSYQLGDAQSRAGRRADAEASLRTAIRHLTPLAATDPDDPQCQVNLAEAYLLLVDLRRFNVVRSAEVDAARAAALVHAENAHRLMPDKAQPLVVLTQIRTAVAAAEESRVGWPSAHLPALLDELRVYERLRDQYPTGHPRSYMRLATTWVSLASTYEYVGRFEEAEAAWRAALVNDDHLVRHFGHEPASTRAMSRHARAWLGLCLIGRNRPDGERLFAEGVADLEAAAGEFPDDAGYRYQMAGLYYRLAHVRHRQRRPDDARAAGRRLLELARGPVTHMEYRAQALILLPTPELRDAAAAARILDAAPEYVAPWLRALILLRNGRPADALAVPDGPGPNSPLVHAACLAAVGRTGDARRTFDDVCRRIDALRLADPEIATLREEVAARLGVAPPPR